MLQSNSTTTYQDPYAPFVPPNNGTTGGGTFNPVPYIAPDFGFYGMLALFAGLFILIAVWYYRTQIAKELARINLRHFNIDQFLSDTDDTDLSEYNRKYGVIIIIGFLGMLAVPMLSISLIPTSFMWVRGIITVMGYFLLILFLWNFISETTNREIREMQNAIWLTNELYIPGRGSYSKTWKKTEPEKEVILSDKQYEVLAKHIIKVARKFGHKFKKGEAVKAKSAIVDRLKEMHIYRTKVKGKGQQSYKILLILKHKWNDVINPNTEELFHKTTDVTVNRAPMHNVYIGESNRIFRKLDTKGSPIMSAVTMGVFISIIDRVTVQNAILSGRFDAMDAQDAIIAQLLGYFEQDATTAEFVNGKITALNKRDKEYDDLKHTKDTESQAQFNTFMRAFNRLFQKHQQKGVFTSALFWIFISFFIYYAVFSAFGWIGG
jgi:hypothetical protein